MKVTSHDKDLDLIDTRDNKEGILMNHNKVLGVIELIHMDQNKQTMI